MVMDWFWRIAFIADPFTDLILQKSIYKKKDPAMAGSFFL